MSDSDQENMMIQPHIESGNLQSKNISLICRNTHAGMHQNQIDSPKGQLSRGTKTTKVMKAKLLLILRTVTSILTGLVSHKLYWLSQNNGAQLTTMILKRWNTVMEISMNA